MRKAVLHFIEHLSGLLGEEWKEDKFVLFSWNENRLMNLTSFILSSILYCIILDYSHSHRNVMKFNILHPYALDFIHHDINLNSTFSAQFSHTTKNFPNAHTKVVCIGKFPEIKNSRDMNSSATVSNWNLFPLFYPPSYRTIWKFFAVKNENSITEGDQIRNYYSDVT